MSSGVKGAGFVPSPVGLGAMGMSVEGRPSAASGVALIREAVDVGVNFIDTADSYHLPLIESVGYGEQLVARALGRPSSGSPVLVATKGGHVRTRASAVGWDVCGHPSYLRSAAIASARRLGCEAIPLYQFHRPDPIVPFGESVGALAELLTDGIAQRVGVSNVTLDQLREAYSILGRDLWSVQNAHSLLRPVDPAISEFCIDRGVRLIVRSPLGGRGRASSILTNETVLAVAASLEVSPAAVALAWCRLSLPGCVLLIGASTRETLVDSLGSTDLGLSREQIVCLSRAFGIARSF